MKSYLDTLECLGYAMPNELGVSFILNSLNKEYNQFVQNYNMHNIGKTIAEFHAILKLHEKGIPKKAETPAMLAIREGKIQKDKKNHKGKRVRIRERISLLMLPSPRSHRRLREIIQKRTMSATTARRWVIGREIGLRESRKLKHGALSLYIGNGMHAAIKAIGSFNLILPSGLIIMILQLTHDESLEKCKSCISGMMARKPFPHQVERAKDLLGLIHTDVCGPFRTVSREGASYFITFTNDFSRYGYVYLMKHKHEVFKTFKFFQNEVKNQIGKKIKVIRSDRGGEYMSHEFVNHMKSYGIVSQLTLPYTPQHNWVFRRRNQTLLDMVRPMMNLTTLPKSFWGYALKKAPKLSYLRVWGCEALVKRDTPGKLDPISIKCIFVGYPKEMMGYYFYYPLENKNIVDRNAKFFENSLMVQEASGSHGLLESSGSDGGLELIQKDDTQPSKILAKYIMMSRLSRYEFYVDVEEYELEDLNEPPNYKAALSDLEFDKWFEAMNTEMQSISWNKRFDGEIKKIGFTQNPDEPGVYLKANGSNVAFLILYVDDILLMRNNVTMLQEVKSCLCSITYAVRCTRPDVAFANTKDMVLVYGEKPEAELKVSCYADASFQTDKDDTKSQRGYVSVLNAEYIVAAKVSMEAVWMRKFIDGLGGVVPSNKRPMEMLCDNEPAITIANDLRILKGDRHFTRKYHYICEVIQEREIVLKKVQTDDNVADPFTKPMPYNKYYEYAMTIGIVHASSLMFGSCKDFNKKFYNSLGSVPNRCSARLGG
ncbi:retrotransposon protein, putative, ty1-copia subclass [Tanacetum coccineum]